MDRSPSPAPRPRCPPADCRARRWPPADSPRPPTCACGNKSPFAPNQVSAAVPPAATRATAHHRQHLPGGGRHRVFMTSPRGSNACRSCCHATPHRARRSPTRDDRCRREAATSILPTGTAGYRSERVRTIASVRNQLHLQRSDWRHLSGPRKPLLLAMRSDATATSGRDLLC
jgi:hypothetical protein